MNGWMRFLVWHRQTRPISRQWLRHSSPSLHSWVLFSFLLFLVFDLGRCTLSPAESALFLDSSQTLPQSIDLSWCNLSPRTRKKTSSIFFFLAASICTTEKKKSVRLWRRLNFTPGNVHVKRFSLTAPQMCLFMLGLFTCHRSKKTSCTEGFSTTWSQCRGMFKYIYNI